MTVENKHTKHQWFYSKWFSFYLLFILKSWRRCMYQNNKYKIESGAMLTQYALCRQNIKHIKPPKATSKRNREKLKINMSLFSLKKEAPSSTTISKLQFRGRSFVSFDKMNFELNRFGALRYTTAPYIYKTCTTVHMLYASHHFTQCNDLGQWNCTGVTVDNVLNVNFAPMFNIVHKLITSFTKPQTLINISNLKYRISTTVRAIQTHQLKSFYKWHTNISYDRYVEMRKNKKNRGREKQK